ncbi:MAG: hypothetical protein PHI12_06265 [Dehalococcoidales bacterium]|nr:hypothetical protein [Dehalococcoidales bacterium]
MQKSPVVIAILTLSILLATGCAGSPLVAPAATEELSLEINEPADEAVVSVSRITVSGKTAADAVVSINGIVADVDAEGIFNGEINLEAGPNVIEVVASDFYGNEKSAVLTVIYAAALPVTVVEPVNDSVVTSPTVTVKGITNTDAVVSVNGNIVSVDETGDFSGPVALDPGPNLIEVLASDFYGNSASVLITVIYNP